MKKYTGNGREIEVLGEDRGVITFKIKYKGKQAIKKLSVFSFDKYLKEINAKEVKEEVDEFDEILASLEAQEEKPKEKHISAFVVNIDKLIGVTAPLINGGYMYIAYIDSEDDDNADFYVSEDESDENYKIIDLKTFFDIIDKKWLADLSTKFEADTPEELMQELSIYFT